MIGEEVDASSLLIVKLINVLYQELNHVLLEKTVRISLNVKWSTH